MKDGLFGKLPDISHSVDNLIRVLLKNVIFENREKFDDDKTLEDWFKELVFNTSTV